MPKLKTANSHQAQVGAALNYLNGRQRTGAMSMPSRHDAKGGLIAGLSALIAGIRARIATKPAVALPVRHRP